MVGLGGPASAVLALAAVVTFGVVTAIFHCCSVSPVPSLQNPRVSRSTMNTFRTGTEELSSSPRFSRFPAIS